jgi:hypothetical protein
MQSGARRVGEIYRITSLSLLNRTFSEILRARETERNRSGMKHFCAQKLPIFDSFQIAGHAYRFCEDGKLLAPSEPGAGLAGICRHALA